MPQNIIGIVITCFVVGLWLFAMVRVFIKATKNKHAPVKTADAVVVDKHTVEAFSKYSGNGKNVKYVVVFSVEGAEKSFYVSPFSYDGYRVSEKGTLKYKGDTIIEFT